MAAADAPRGGGAGGGPPAAQDAAGRPAQGEAGAEAATADQVGEVRGGEGDREEEEDEAGVGRRGAAVRAALRLRQGQGGRREELAHGNQGGFNKTADL